MSIAINQFEVMAEPSAQPNNEASKKVDKSSPAATGPAAVQEQALLISAALSYLCDRRARVRAH